MYLININKKETDEQAKKGDVKMIEASINYTSGHDINFNDTMRSYIKHHAKEIGDGVYVIKAVRPFSVDIKEGTTTLSISTTGCYRNVCMTFDLVTHTITVRACIHELVAILGMNNYTGDVIVNHKDNDNLNNKISNLELLTQSENMIHAAIIKRIFKALGFTSKGRIKLDKSISYHDIDSWLISNIGKNNLEYQQRLKDWYISYLNK